jgi:serine/threonine-protein kinase
MLNKKPIDYALYTLIYLILFFLAADLSSQIILRGELVSLPALQGKSLEQARLELAVKKTALVIRGYQFDSRYEKGKIISQEPGPRSRVKANRTVSVFVSSGSESVTVPRLEGRSLETATQTLKSIGLRKGRVSQIHTPQYAAGRIIAQQPPASEAIGRNAPVDILVSQGAWEARYIMPDLIEKNADAVIRKLKTLDFQVTEVHSSYYPGLGPGIIIKQSPAHGFRIQKRNQIMLEVSK